MSEFMDGLLSQIEVDIDVFPDLTFTCSKEAQNAIKNGKLKVIIDLTTGEILNKSTQKIEINDHVWIGRGATIMPDTHIS